MKLKYLEFWIDINLPPSMAVWIRDSFDVGSKSFLELGFLKTSDVDVFRLAQTKNDRVVVTTKDIDFLQFQKQATNPPKVLHINTGNISNKQLKQLIIKSLPEVIRIFTETNQTLIEITNQS